MNDTKLEPLGAHVLLRYVEQEAAKAPPQIGEVVAIGEDEKIRVRVGQKALFPKYTGTGIKLNAFEFDRMDAADQLKVFKG
ncbi:MAG: hypothetical protein JXA13_12330 [Anaerolineales bacterium]|nr:hypothetical protein [Anaerolineales bacterium]